MIVKTFSRRSRPAKYRFIALPVPSIFWTLQAPTAYFQPVAQHGPAGLVGIQ